jgi:tRNA (guanine-N7-)-methyltransferase
MTEAEHHPQQKLFGRRKGPKSSARQFFLRQNLLPGLSLDLAGLVDPCGCFAPRVQDVWLEIGFGAGEHLLEQAQKTPTVGLIGAEAYQSGTDKLLSKLGDLATLPANLRLYEGDGRDILERLPDAALGKVFLLFPDPWPKTRHAARRFVQTEILDVLARVLKPGGEFRLASDDAKYIAWSLERLCAHPAFAWTASGPDDWRVHPTGWPVTRYEQKALHGPPVYLSFRRMPSQ